MLDIDIVIRNNIDSNNFQELGTFLRQIQRNESTTVLLTLNLHYLIITDHDHSKHIQLYHLLLQHGASADVMITRDTDRDRHNNENGGDQGGNNEHVHPNHINWLGDSVLPAVLYMIAERFHIDKITLMYQYSSIPSQFSLHRYYYPRLPQPGNDPKADSGRDGHRDEEKIFARRRPYDQTSSSSYVLRGQPPSIVKSKPNYSDKVMKNPILSRYSKLFHAESTEVICDDNNHNPNRDNHSGAYTDNHGDQHDLTSPDLHPHPPVPGHHTTATDPPKPSLSMSQSSQPSSSSSSSQPSSSSNGTTIQYLTLQQMLSHQYTWSSDDPSTWHPFHMALAVNPSNIPLLAVIAKESIHYKTNQLDFPLISTLKDYFRQRDVAMPYIPSKTLEWLRCLLSITLASTENHPHDPSLHKDMVGCTSSHCISLGNADEHGKSHVQQQDHQHHDCDGRGDQPSRLAQFLDDSLAPDGLIYDPFKGEFNLWSVECPNHPLNDAHLIEDVVTTPSPREVLWVLDLAGNHASRDTSLTIPPPSTSSSTSPSTSPSTSSSTSSSNIISTQQLPIHQSYSPLLLKYTLYHHAHGYFTLKHLLRDVGVSVLYGYHHQQNTLPYDHQRKNHPLHDEHGKIPYRGFTPLHYAVTASDGDDDNDLVDLFYQDYDDIADIYDYLAYSMLYHTTGDEYNHKDTDTRWIRKDVGWDFTRNADAVDPDYDQHTTHRFTPWLISRYLMYMTAQQRRCQQHDDKDHLGNRRDTNDINDTNDTNDTNEQSILFQTQQHHPLSVDGIEIFFGMNGAVDAHAHADGDDGDADDGMDMNDRLIEIHYSSNTTHHVPVPPPHVHPILKRFHTALLHHTALLSSPPVGCVYSPPIITPSVEHKADELYRGFLQYVIPRRNDWGHLSIKLILDRVIDEIIESS